MRLGSSVVPIELHCGDVLRTSFDVVNFCPFDTFLKNTLMQINSKLNLKSYDDLYKHCLLTEKFALPFTKKNSQNSLPTTDSRFDILFVTMLIKLLYCVNFNFILNVTFN